MTTSSRSKPAVTRVPVPCPAPPAAAVERCIKGLCLSCAICCNGVLFADVRIPQPAQARALCRAGLAVRRSRRSDATPALPQPCPALRPDNQCAFYHLRPARCREFECALLQKLISGAVDLPEARRIVAMTLENAGQVRQGLRALEETHEEWPLARRFRRVKRSFARREITEQAAATYADLTLDVHRLNMTLRHHFYPEPKDKRAS